MVLDPTRPDPREPDPLGYTSLDKLKQPPRAILAEPTGTRTQPGGFRVGSWVLNFGRVRPADGSFFHSGTRNPTRYAAYNTAQYTVQKLTRCDAYNKKRGIDLKTTRHVSIQLVPGTEAGPIKPVDAVSPTDGTGHPQLTDALRYAPKRACARVVGTLIGTYERPC